MGQTISSFKQEEFTKPIGVLTYTQTNRYGDKEQDSMVIYKPETIERLANAGCYDLKFNSWYESKK